MLPKEKVLEIIQSLPDEFTLDELVGRLILLEKVTAGLREVQEGKVVSQEEIREKVNLTGIQEAEILEQRFSALLSRLRAKEGEAPSLEEATKEVETIRAEQKKDNR